jgi:acid stress-induced BolA-like protein IbaG/YrbA
MQVEEIKALIQSQISEAHVDAQIDGNHVSLVVISERFEGLNAVKRQQLVYACLQEQISSGAIHAVHMKTYTVAESESRQN